MPIKQHDFIEIEYTGKLKDGTIFDTTDEKLAKENNLYNKNMAYGPIIICLGENQILPGLDEFLEGKETGQDYQVELPPEKAFGKKDAKKIKLIPPRAFKKSDIQPQPGLQINIDNELGTILRASGGRILVDFNHPLANKEVDYSIKVLRQVTDKKEQILSFLQAALNLKDIQVEVKENKAIITLPFELPPPAQEPLKKKLTELTQVKEIEIKKLEKKEPTKKEPENKTTSQD